MPDDVLTDDEVLEMVRKGCSRFMRGYPWLARDIFQAGAEAACLARSRGHSGGAMMLYITGAAKDLLSEFSKKAREEITTGKFSIERQKKDIGKIYREALR